MSTINQTTQKVSNGGVADLLRSGLKTGLGVAEGMHQFAVEIPLNMLKVVGVSDEQTSALKDKHRSLLRGMYGSIDSVATQMTDVGEKQATLLADGIRDLTKGVKAEAKTTAKKATKVVKAEAKATEKKATKVVKEVAKVAKEDQPAK